MLFAASFELSAKQKVSIKSEARVSYISSIIELLQSVMLRMGLSEAYDMRKREPTSNKANTKK